MKKFTLYLLLVMLINAISNEVSAQRITVTVAGNGSSGYSGDNGPGKMAKISAPQLISADLAGNLYFVDANKIRMVSALNGVITTVAGGGTSSADGIPALSASITPTCICTDPAGKIYLVSSNKIRIIDPATWIINTYAGTGTAGYGGDGGPAASALFNSITGICSDNSGNIFIVDNLNYRIREINALTGIISTTGGNGTSGYTGDGGPATGATIGSAKYIGTNSAGDVFFVDQGSTYIRKIDGSSGNIITYAGGGGSIEHCLATSTFLATTTGMCVDAVGNIVFNEISCSCREINHLTDSTKYIGGNFSMESFRDDTNSLYAWMDMQYGVTSDGKNNVFIADNGNSRIRKLINVTSLPSFAYGKGETFTPCPGYAYNIDSFLAITDLDVAQSETWSVITPPVFGSLSGFPATTLSIGLVTTVKPAGISYLAPSGFTGNDSFKIQVTDGTASDTITMYASVQMASTSPITGLTNFCVNAGAAYSDAAPYPGVWSASNGNININHGTGSATGISAGIDTIIFTLTSTCPLTATYIVTVNPLPATGTITGSDTVCSGTTSLFSDAVTGGAWSSMSPSIASVGVYTGLVTGITYGSTFIEYTTSNAWCTSYTTKMVRVFAPVEPLTATSALCTGSTAYEYDDIGGGTWSLSNSHIAITGTGSDYVSLSGVSAGLDTIMYTNTNSCGSGTVTRILTVNPLPSPGMISGPSAVCIGSSVTLTCTLSGGTWSSVNGYTTVGYITGLVTGMSPGVDSISYTISTSGCSAYASVPITVINTLPSAGTISGPATVCAGTVILLADGIGGGTWSVSNSNASVSGTGSVAGITTGSDSVIYTVSNACGSAIAASVIAVNPLPEAGTVTGPGAVCTGSLISLYDAASGGTWVASNSHSTVSTTGIVSGITTGTDTIIYTVTNSCGTSTASSVITINPLPDAGAITGHDTVCIGAAVNLTDAAAGGNWTTSNSRSTVSSSGVVTGLTAGVDTIIYTVTNSCGTAAAKEMVVIHKCSSVGISPVNANSGISVYPNPAATFVNIDWEAVPQGSIYASLTDITGRVILTSEFINSTGKGSDQLNVASLMPGVYLLTINSGTLHFTHKMVISR